MIESALKYAGNGWKIFPLHNVQNGKCTCGNKEGCKPGKHPRFSGWPEAASCDFEVVRKWWTDWPQANIGLTLGGLFVLDSDPRNGGDTTLAALEADLQAGESITCYAPIRQSTAQGGTHFLYLGYELPKKAVKPKGLDLLTGPGHYIVVEPSFTHAGAYKWTAGVLSPLSATREELCLTPLPKWFQEVIAGKTTSNDGRVPVERLIAAALEQITVLEGRNAAGFWLACQLRDNKYNKTLALSYKKEWVERANAVVPGAPERYKETEFSASVTQAYDNGEEREEWGKKPSGENQADILLAMTEDFEYFKSGPANEPYVRVTIGDHSEVWPAGAASSKVREILTHRYL